MKESLQEPIYSITTAAKFLKVCSATLRIWERKGLIKPSRIGKNRAYSHLDIDRLKYIKNLIQKKGANIQGVKNILATTRCWELKKCSFKERDICPVYLKYGHV